MFPRNFLALAIVCAGCAGGFPPAGRPALAVFECQVAALSELDLPVAAVEDLVMAARAGQAEYVVRQLLALDVSPEDISAAGAAFHACAPPNPVQDSEGGPADGPPELLGT